MNYFVRISTNPQVWSVAESVDNVANLVRSCNCADATNRGPMCKHAAACLPMECRMVQRLIAEGQEPEVEQQPSPSSGKWMLERFRKLTKVGRLSRKELPTQAMLALPDIPRNEVVAVGPSGLASPRIKHARSAWNVVWLRGRNQKIAKRRQIIGMKEPPVIEKP